MRTPRPRDPDRRVLALDALKRVVEGCVAGLEELPEALDGRHDDGWPRRRERLLARLAANAVAQRVAWEQHGVLRTELPDHAQADVGIDLLQGLSEAYALLLADAGSPLIPGHEDLARWIADPEVLGWLQHTCGAVPEDVLAWARRARAQLEPRDVGPVRNAEVRRALLAEVREAPGGYRVLADAYVDPGTRAVAREAAWDRLVALAHTLRDLKGPSCRLTQFDGQAIWARFALLHQVFASLALMAQGEEAAGMLLAPDELDLHASACAS
jgi:hypothetical protein